MRQDTVSQPVPPELWGRDHESTMLYAETVCVDRSGKPDIRRMRCDPNRHLEFVHLPAAFTPCSPTRLANDELMENHDDWDCINDFVAAGMIEVAAGPSWRLTDLGWAYAHELRRARAGRLLRKALAESTPIQAVVR